MHEFTPEMVKRILQELGLYIMKFENKPVNVGRSPEVVLAEAINKELGNPD